jgi:DNA-binding transcriptional MerR regulator
MGEKSMKIGELAKATGLTTKTIRFYEQQALLKEPLRTSSGYRIYTAEDVERLEFIRQAKRISLSLEEIRDILDLSEQSQAPCVHVLALLERKLEQVDAIIQGLQEFRGELSKSKEESQERLDRLPEESRICGIIEKGIHTKGEVALRAISATPGRRYRPTLSPSWAAAQPAGPATAWPLPGHGGPPEAPGPG